ncbi:pilus assembly protein TadG-related protein [Streptomyces xiamenensis]|uniref:pilus assembly protein TadG-related protein n=1 Tax=Streptomyces xiamenensis TaxID=408015 RepID=UPI0036EEAD6D
MTLFVLVTIVALFAIAGLVIDGGGKLRARTHAEGAAHEAARAGGQAIDAGKAIAGDGIAVDRGAAVAAASAYLSDAGLQGSVRVSEDGRTLEVTVYESYDPVFLGGGGWTVTGSGTASLVSGGNA